MYKSVQISFFFKTPRLRYFLILIVCLFFYTDHISQIDDYIQNKSDTIVIITTTKNKEIRGVLIHENKDIIAIEVSNREIAFLKNEIKSYKYITREEIKSITEFVKPNPIYTRYCYMPSAFITENKYINTYSHYFVTSNSKLGINDNIEVSVGNIVIFNLFLSGTYSKEISSSFTGAVSAIGNTSLFVSDTSSNSTLNFLNGVGLIPRLTFGDKFKNKTIGFIGYQFTAIDRFIYGGYFGGQKKISERFTISGESMGFTSDGYQFLIITNLIANFLRNTVEDWSIGVTLISVNDPQAFSNLNFGNPVITENFIPIPYIGFQRRF